MEGSYPPDQIDHINGDRADNRWTNLRHANNTENSRNTKIACNNSSGVTGVCFNKREQKWRAAIGNNGKVISLGDFDNFDDAVRARKEAEKLYNYHPNHGRSI